MNFFFSPPPAVPHDLVIKHLKLAYGLAGDFQALAAERDQNFRIETGKASFLFKVCAADEGFALAQAQVQALQHIAFTDPTLPLPRATMSKSGGCISTLHHEGIDYPGLLLDWLPGDVLADQAETHLSEFGTLLPGWAAPCGVLPALRYSSAS